MSGLASFLSKHLAHPLYANRDGSRLRLKELSRLRKSQWEPWADKQARLWARVRGAVERAYGACPFYRERGPLSLAGWEDFARIPLLTKEDVRRRKDALLAEGFPARERVASKTGGSTGTSLEIYCDQAAQQIRNGAAFWTDQWAGWDLGEAVGALWGNPPAPKTWREAVRARLLDRTLYLDTVSLGDQDMAEFLTEAARRGIHFLFGHAHSLYVLARHAEARGLPAGLSVRGIISTSMTLLPSERRVIERVFGCAVTNRYGCEEVGLIAAECEKHEGLHMNVEHLHIEILKDDGSPARPGETGRVVVTDLVNRAMPLIRYAVGDMAVPSGQPCSCGRGLPLLAAVTGRTADFLLARDGRLVAGVSLVERTLTAIAGLERLQIIQEKPDRVRLNVVPDADWNAAGEEKLLSAMREALGEGIEFDLRRVTALEQEKNGKYRFAICRVGSAYQQVAAS